MACPRCKSKVRGVKADDGSILRFCNNPECDYVQLPGDEGSAFHNTSSACTALEKEYNGRVQVFD